MEDNQPEITPMVDERSWAERNGFPSWLLGTVWVIVAFVIFQVVGTLVAVLLLLGEGSGFDLDNIAELAFEMLLGNSLGQIIGLGLATMVVALLSVKARNYKVFMRFTMPKYNTGLVFVFAILLVIVAQPFFWFLAHLNMQLPLPELVSGMDDMQIELLEGLLAAGLPILFMLFAIAVVPGVCEEILFRSYLLRLFEKSTGVILAIIITGIIFGLFHLRFSQIIPLSVIGMLLAWVTIQSGSVFPAMLMHFIHNGGTVIAIYLYPELITMEPEASLPPFWLVIGSIVATIFLLYRYPVATINKEGVHYVQEET